MSEFVRAYQPNQGIVGAETTPADQDALYASPEEMEALFGCRPETSDLLFAQSLIHAHCNRASLWPTELEFSDLRIPDDRQEFRIPITPVLRLLDISGRLGYGRRDRRMNANTFGALLMLSGGRPQWSSIDPNSCEIQSSTGVVYIPTSLWFMPFAAVRCRAVCGFVTIPPRVKAAIANIINDIKVKGASDRTAHTVGRVSHRFASSTFISEQTKMLLEPFVVRSLF